MTSSSSRCCGSITLDSAGLNPKKLASKRSASLMKPPWRTVIMPGALGKTKEKGGKIKFQILSQIFSSTVLISPSKCLKQKIGGGGGKGHLRIFIIVGINVPSFQWNLHNAILNVVPSTSYQDHQHSIDIL